MDQKSYQNFEEDFFSDFDSFAPMTLWRPFCASYIQLGSHQRVLWLLLLHEALIQVVFLVVSGKDLVPEPTCTRASWERGFTARADAHAETIPGKEKKTIIFWCLCFLSLDFFNRKRKKILENKKTFTMFKSPTPKSAP